MIEIDNASIAYGQQVLFAGLSFQVEKGKMACITGESGTGKTSLLNAVMGFVPLSEGRIIVDGTALTPDTVGALRSRIAWVPQELALPAEWVSEMVSIPFELRQNKRRCAAGDKNCSLKEPLMECFAALGLEPELYDKRVNEISGGQRQRIMIAVASLLNKDILIMDEPTSALDPASIDRVIDYLHRLQLKGMTVLAVSHDSHFITACDTILTIPKHTV